MKYSGNNSRFYFLLKWHFLSTQSPSFLKAKSVGGRSVKNLMEIGVAVHAWKRDTGIYMGKYKQSVLYLLINSLLIGTHNAKLQLYGNCWVFKVPFWYKEKWTLKFVFWMILFLYSQKNILTKNIKVKLHKNFFWSTTDWIGYYNNEQYPK